MSNIDFLQGPWWITVSGAGTPSAAVESWADDYTKHRSGVSSTYTSTSSIIGRKESIKDVNP